MFGIFIFLILITFVFFIDNGDEQEDKERVVSEVDVNIRNEDSQTHAFAAVQNDDFEDFI